MFIQTATATAPPPGPHLKVGINTWIRDGRITELQIPFKLQDREVEPLFRLPPAPLGDATRLDPWKNRRGKKNVAQR